MSDGKIPPAILCPWLYYQASLIKKLKSVAGEAVLTVLKQHVKKTSWWDKFTLELPEQKVMQREVIISAQKKTCWYARTIIPQATWDDEQRFFERLKYESLGEIIFTAPNIKRERLLVYPLTAQTIEYYWVMPFLIEKASELWARLSFFVINEQSPFFLSEIFLPSLSEIT